MNLIEKSWNCNVPEFPRTLPPGPINLRPGKGAADIRMETPSMLFTLWHVDEPDLFLSIDCIMPRLYLLNSLCTARRVPMHYLRTWERIICSRIQLSNASSANFSFSHRDCPRQSARKLHGKYKSACFGGKSFVQLA